MPNPEVLTVGHPVGPATGVVLPTPHLGSNGGTPLDPADDIYQPYRPTALTAQSKFTWRISEAPIKRKLKKSNIVTKYNASTDPNNQINVFVSAGGIKGWAIHEWYQMFVQTLIGPARLWFDSLMVGRIDSFDDLVANFLQHFCQ